MSDLSDLNLDVENEAQDERAFEPLPDGIYPAIVTDSDMKETKAGTGRYMAFTFEVIDGDYKGRLLWTNMNINNPNEIAERIGRQELASLCKAVGVMNPKDSTELHDIPLMIKVGRDKKEADRNAIKAYMPMGDAVAAQTKKAEAPKAAASAPAKKPWQR